MDELKRTMKKYVDKHAPEAMRAIECLAREIVPTEEYTRTERLAIAGLGLVGYAICKMVEKRKIDERN